MFTRQFKSLLVVLVGLICLPFISYGVDIPALLEKAEQGDATAQCNLGDAYCLSASTALSTAYARPKSSSAR
jgi:hypothetical protein